MIHLHRVQRFEEKQNVFDRVRQGAFSWIVADVQSRTFLQNQLLNFSNAIEEGSTVVEERASA